MEKKKWFLTEKNWTKQKQLRTSKGITVEHERKIGASARTHFFRTKPKNGIDINRSKIDKRQRV